MKCFVYIVKCSDESFYTGISWNPRKRENEHNSHIKTPIQKGRLPVKLIFVQEYNNRNVAAKREKEIKGWSRKKKTTLINSELNELEKLNECK